MSFKPAFEHFQFVNAFPVEGEVLGGAIDAFDDQRFDLLDGLAPVADRRVLELGPLEGAHTILLHRRGAREVIAIEGRVDNLYKCCLIKNVFRLDRACFLLGDLEDCDLAAHGRFDLCLCLGILYHLRNPAHLLDRIAEVTDTLYVWTCVAADHYPVCDATELVGTFRTGKRYAYRGKHYQEEQQESRAALRPTSFWPFEADLLRMLHDTGFDDVQILNRSEMYAERLSVVLLLAKRPAGDSQAG